MSICRSTSFIWLLRICLIYYSIKRKDWYWLYILWTKIYHSFPPKPPVCHLPIFFENNFEREVLHPLNSHRGIKRSQKAMQRANVPIFLYSGNFISESLSFSFYYIRISHYILSAPVIVMTNKLLFYQKKKSKKRNEQC